MKINRRFSTAVKSILIFLILMQFMGCQAIMSSSREQVFFEIKGTGIEEEVQISLKELQDMEESWIVEEYFSINTYGTQEYTEFKGIWVWELLQSKAKLDENASKVTFIAEDGYQVTYSIEEVKREDYMDEQNPETQYKMIVAWEKEGTAFDSQEGLPFQLVVGQKEPGDVNKPYWVQNIKIIEIN